jgi:glutathione S-transferase
MMKLHYNKLSWLVGDSITLADIAVGTPLMGIRTARLPIRPSTHLLAWFGRISEQPAWKATEPPAIG